MAYTSALPAGNTMANQALAADGRALNALKVQAGQNSPEAAREAAKQFESLFMREMIKSMREATMKSGLLDGAEGNLANDMYDQQLSVQMSGLPGGLTEAIQRQLTRQMGGTEAELSIPSTLSLDTSALRRTASTKNSTTPSPKGLDAFVQHHRATAERVAQDSGIPASFMLGQAGHETGWGKGEIRHKDGSAAYNLFGIKAGKNWTGKVAEVTTTEYINGVARKVTAKFRAYDSYEDSFPASSTTTRATRRHAKRSAPPWPMPRNCKRPATPPTPSTPASSAAPSKAPCGSAAHKPETARI